MCSKCATCGVYLPILEMINVEASQIERVAVD
jgi:hypothetical protein